MQPKHPKIKLISSTVVNPIVNYPQENFNNPQQVQENAQYQFYPQVNNNPQPKDQFYYTQTYPQQQQQYIPVDNMPYTQYNNYQNFQPYQSFQIPSNQYSPDQCYLTQQHLNNCQQIQIQQYVEEEKLEFVKIPDGDIFSRHYQFKKIEYAQPVKELKDNSILDQKIYLKEVAQQGDEIPDELEPVEETKKKKKKRQKNKKQKGLSKQQDQITESLIEQQLQEVNSIEVIQEGSETVYSMAQEFDDAINDSFFRLIDQYMKDEYENASINLTQSIYGKQKKQIIIKEIVGFEEIIDQLCQEFPQIKYSEITMTLKLLVTFEKSRHFLLQYHPESKQRVLRQINQLIQEEQLAKTQNDQNDLLKTQVRIGELQQALQPQLQEQLQNQSEELSLLSTAYQIIEKKNYNVNSCKNDQRLKQQKKEEFSQNRAELVTCYNQKADLVRQYQCIIYDYLENLLTQEAFERKLQGNRNRKLKLQDKGRELFLQLMIIERDFCRVDFHKFFAAEIEDLLDGMLDYIESYKIGHGSGRIKLQIIVGKGKHSVGGKPIIGPITQQYLRQELQQNVIIKEGIIDVFV